MEGQFITFKEPEMKREILFRGKRVDNGEWVEGFYVNKNKDKHQIVTNNDIWPILVIPETVGQFTGLTDKNGSNVFNEDVCTSNTTDFNFLVKWDNEACAYLALRGEEKVPFSWFSRIRESELVVIGNIHDNPELLTP